ncbi:MAG TPA: PEP-CTERM sorting domain-containing protein [Bacteroidota bacterium]|nr:PEP-CTERM sorting domain-containing protein [Bacteroidota bacterium]
MGLDPRSHLVSVVAGLALSFAPGRGHALNADVLTISAGTGYTGAPVELTIPEANQSPALTILLSSPLAGPPTDVSVLELPDGIHTIHIAPGTRADQVNVDFLWFAWSPQVFAEICSSTVGFAQGGCMGGSTESQDLTPLIFPSSAFPNGAPFQVVLQSDAAPVPEPSSLSLIGCGIAGLLLVRRRRPGS